MKTLIVFAVLAAAASALRSSDGEIAAKVENFKLSREFVGKDSGYRPDLAKGMPRTRAHGSSNRHRDVPDEIDWRATGYVTDVKDQGQCGSGWAFSATGALEGQMFSVTKILVSLSEQNLIDCSPDSTGCNVGDPATAMAYIQNNGGINSEETYPYIGASDQGCQYDSSNVAAQVTGYTVVPATEEDLKAAVANIGPISVVIDSSHYSFQNYDGGVYYEPICSSTILDHAVLVVGYGTEGSDDYWLVKNSWGPSWGENGYIRMARNRDNNCGIASQACYPNV